MSTRPGGETESERGAREKFSPFHTDGRFAGGHRFIGNEDGRVIGVIKHHFVDVFGGGRFRPVGIEIANGALVGLTAAAELAPALGFNCEQPVIQTPSPAAATNSMIRFICDSTRAEFGRVSRLYTGILAWKCDDFPIILKTAWQRCAS